MKCDSQAAKFIKPVVSQDVYFRATQLGNEALAKTARGTAQQIPVDGGELPMTSDQLKLLHLLSSESQHHPETSPHLLGGGWDEEVDGQYQGGGDWLEGRLANQLMSMKFDTSNGRCTTISPFFLSMSLSSWYALRNGFTQYCRFCIFLLLMNYSC